MKKIYNVTFAHYGFVQLVALKNQAKDLIEKL